MLDRTAGAANLTAEQRREMLRQILEKKAREARGVPLSLGQEALWFLERLDPGRPTYGFYPATRIRGPLDMRALTRAFGELIRRHESLRTIFPEVDGAPVQRVTPPTEDPLPVIDLRHLPPDEREAECRRLSQSRPAIDLQNGPILRAQLLRMGDDDHVVKLYFHHIVFDGWSLGVLARELFVLYQAFKAGQPSPLPPLEAQFKDFALWQRNYLQGEKLTELQDHWRNKLAGLPPLSLATDYPRPAVRTSRGATFPLNLSRDLSDAVLAFSRREHFTPFMTLLAAFQEVLRRYSGQDDFAVGTPTANRRQKSYERLIGYFINVLVLRADLSGDPTFRQLVQRVRDTSLDAYQHQELTLDKIVEAVQPPRDLSRHPLFQVMFVVQNTPQPKIELPDLHLAPVAELNPDRSAKFELTVPLRVTDQGIIGKINFNTDLFAPDTIQRMVRHYEMVLTDALANPDVPLSQLALLTPGERQQILADWNGRRASLPTAQVFSDLVSAQAQRNPAAIAIIDGTLQWTYGEIERYSNQLAWRLRKLGVGPESKVGVCLDRSGELYVVLLAIMKAGGAYVPIDPQHVGGADERLRFVLEDSGAALLVTNAVRRSLVAGQGAEVLVLEQAMMTLEEESDEPLPATATPENLAYVIYTSGSTGRPKGVMVTHDNLLNAWEGWRQEYRLDTEVRTHLQMASFGFDVFTGDLVRAFGSGGTLVLCTKETMLDPAQLLDLMKKRRVDAAEFVPVVLRQLVDHLIATQQTLDFARLIAVGSDAWYVEDHQRALEVLGPRTRLVNSYGLTETTIDSTYFEGDVRSLPTTGVVPIGRPFPNVRLYVLDAWRRPVPIGVAGELYIGGRGVARGYLNRPELDAERFVDDPFVSDVQDESNGSVRSQTAPAARVGHAARLCRTGDRVRWRTDGQLEFLGRADDQVKIRGFRIEPAEVEEVLREHPLLAEAAVMPRERRPGDLRLVAYLEGRGGTVPAAAELRRFLGERVPEYMVPSLFLTLSKLPTTPNGKVDRRGLPEPNWEDGASDVEFTAPRTPLEEQLAGIWREVLNVQRVGALDSFFDLGGNSLLAVRLIARLRTEFHVEVPLVTLFAAPTLGALAERIEESRNTAVPQDTSPMPRVSRVGGVALSFAQEAYYHVIRMFAGQPISNVHASLLIRGTLDLETMRRTINEVVRRHESLRTYFFVGVDGQPRQKALGRYEVDLPLFDLRSLTPEERAAEVQKLSHEQYSRPFDIEKPPLFRIQLVRLADQEHVLVTTVTHIVFDGWSLQVLMREVSEIYEALRMELPPPFGELNVQYADFAAWERQTLQGERFDALLNYWREKLNGVRSPALPLARQAPSGIRHVRQQFETIFQPEMKARVERLSRASRVTPYIVMLATFKLLLSRWCRSTDIAVTAPVANRRRAETQRMIGVFVNTIVLRSDLSGEPTFRELLRRVQETTNEGLAHEEMPIDVLVEKLQPEYDGTRFPIVQVMFNYLQPDASQRVRRRRELQIEPLSSYRDPISTRTDVALQVTDAKGRLRANFKYDSALFDAALMERMSHDYRELLEAVLENPDTSLSEIAPHVRTPQASDVVVRAIESPPEAAAPVITPQAAPLTVPAVAAASATVPATTVETFATNQTVQTAKKAGRSVTRRWLAPLRPGVTGLPLYCIHGLGGHIAGFLPLARQLDEGRPIYGLQAQGLDGAARPHSQLDEMAACYASEIRQVQPTGPYCLLGWSLGGLIAIEVARRLVAEGGAVPMIAMLDTHLRVSNRDIPEMSDAALLQRIAPQLKIPLTELRGIAPQQMWELIAERAAESTGAGIQEIRWLAETCRAHLTAVARYTLPPCAQRVTLYRSEQSRVELDPRWATFCPQLQVAVIPGDHYTLLQTPHVATVARLLDRELSAADALAGTGTTS